MLGSWADSWFMNKFHLFLLLLLCVRVCVHARAVYARTHVFLYLCIYVYITICIYIGVCI